MAVMDKSISERCNGCGICLAVCPKDVFRLNKSTKTAIVKYPQDCVACGSCEEFCPRNCLEVYLNELMNVPSPY